MAPAIVLVVLFFLVPVALTAVFSFTTMSTSTGITGGAYQLAPNAIQRLRDQFGMVELAQKLGEPSFVIDERGLATLEAKGVAPGIVAELRSNHLNETFTVRRDVERMIRSLRERPSTPEVKLISAEFSRSLANARFADEAALFAAVKAIDAQLTEDEKAALAAASYTGWTWTTENFRRMVSTPDTARTLFNTLAYVSLTLVLFNTGFAMMLALAVHYMPERPAGFFRICGFCHASRRPSSTC